MEALDDTEEQIRFLEGSYRRFLEVFITHESSDIQVPCMEHITSRKEVLEKQVSSGFTLGAHNSLSYLRTRCSMYRRWVSTYKDRTNIQINLVSTTWASQSLARGWIINKSARCSIYQTKAKHART